MVDAATIPPVTSSLERRADLGTDGSAQFTFWMQQLKLAEREDRDFVKRGRRIVRRYRDERGVNESDRDRSRFNILWANVETLKPVLYGRTPQPDVRRRHENNNDPIGLMGAEIISRCLQYEDDIEQFDQVMKQVVEDRLLPGRGVARVFYEAEFGDETEDFTQEPDEDGEQPTIRPVESETAPVRYVFWEDYRESPARTEHEVWWKGYRSYLTRDELVTRFGSKKGNAVSLDYTPKGLGDFDDNNDGPLADAFKKAQVWEIWDKVKGAVVWLAPSYGDDLLDKQDDPLELPGFFPSPRTLKSTVTNEKNVPVADYKQYQDQAEELDVLTARITNLTRALMVKGVYAASEKSTIQQLVSTTVENQLIPVEDWAMFAGDKGGVDKMISWLPIEQIAKVVIQLYDARDRALKVLYQVTGIADILRGETDPNETLGAQQLKGQFATRRITEAQKDVARFARDLMRLRGSVIARHFSTQTLAEMSGMPEPMPELPPPPPQMVPIPPQMLQAMMRPQGQPGMPPPSGQPGAMPPPQAPPHSGMVA